MISKLRVTVLAENSARRRDLLAEHGLALWVCADGRNILFDTGQGLVLKHNAQVLGFDLPEVQDVVLSHGHYDHIGGLVAWPSSFRKANVYVHPAAFQGRFSLTADGEAKFSGSSLGGTEALEGQVAKIVLTETPTEIVDGVWVTGQIPRCNDFEDVGGRFSLDEAGNTPDTIPDDQAMYIETPDGLVVLLGCCHAGVVNTLDYIAKTTGQRTFHAVMGGMHLERASTQRLEKTMAVLQELDVRIVAPAHCTGAGPTGRMARIFADRFLRLSVGVTATFP